MTQKYIVRLPGAPEPYVVTVRPGENEKHAAAYAMRMEAQRVRADAQQRAAAVDSPLRKIAGVVDQLAPSLFPGGAGQVVKGLISSPLVQQTRAGFAQGAAHASDKAAEKLQGIYNTGAQGVNAVTGAHLPISHSATNNPAISKQAETLGPGNAVGKAAGELGTIALLTKNIPGAFGQGAAASYIMSDSKDPVNIAMDTLLGGASGWAFNKAINALSSVIAPKIEEAASYLQSKGIRQTPGQAIPALKRWEDKVMSRPFIGGQIEAGRQQSFKDLTRSLAQETLDPIGTKLPNGIEGRPAVKWAGDHLSSQYEALIPNLRLVPDQQLGADIVAASQTVNNGDMSPKAVAQFEAVIKNQIVPRLNGSNPLTGQQYRGIEKNLSAQIARFGKSKEPDNQATAAAFKELQGAFQAALQRSNPDQAEKLAALNLGWAKLVRVEGAYTGQEGGYVTPGAFWRSMKSADSSVRHRAVARGDALMQDFADNAAQILPSKYPDSGTSGRAQTNPLNPMYWLGAAQGSLYGPRTQQAITNAALAPRPQAAQSVAELLRQIPAGPAGAALGSSFFSGGW